jgi:hypothetical protein
LSQGERSVSQMPFQLGKLLVVIGIAFVGLGLLLMFGSSFLGLGKLPGDIAYRGKNFSFYFPIVTSLLLSAVITLVLWLFSFLSRK